MYFKIFSNIAKVLFASLVVAFSAAGVYLLSVKPDLPFEYRYEGNLPVISADYGNVKSNSIIKSIDGIGIVDNSFLEPYLDKKKTGDTVYLLTENMLIPVALGRAYPDNTFIIISLVVAVSMFIFGIFITNRKPMDARATLLFLMFNLFALALCTSPGKIPSDAFILAVSVRTVHAFSYMFGIAMLIHFAFIFPSPRFRRKNLWIVLVYLLFAAFFLLVAVSQHETMLNVVNTTTRFFHALWNIFLAVIALCIALSGLLFFKSYYRNSYEDRRRIQWILLGLIFGVLPYLCFYIIPSLFHLTPVLREEFAFGFMFLIPVTFTIGIIRHHLFDIEIIFRRSLVYSLLTFLVFGIYSLIVFVLSNLFVGFIGNSQILFSFIAAVLISVSVNPLRHLIQNYVNKVFYREKYDFNTFVNGFISKVIDFSTISDLSASVIWELNRVIPSVWSAFIVRSESGLKFRIANSINCTEEFKNSIGELLLALRKNNGLGFILPAEKESANKDIHLFMEKLKAGLILPLKLEKDTVIGYLIFGNKLSGLKFSESDLMLLNTVSSAIALALNKLNIQEILLAREVEKEKLEALDKMKSDFVSNVSHELKTPLTSIQMFIDTLMERTELTEEKKTEYLRVISGESDRLHRLINSLLDFSRFESGLKHFQFEEVKLDEILEYVLVTFEYQFSKHSAAVTKQIGGNLPHIIGDPDAIAEVFINLLSNALKYSRGIPVIGISAFEQNGGICVKISDKGIGIPAEYKERIFEKFFRVQNNCHTGGMGIGLTVVKEIMEAHNATVSVESEEGKGSVFILNFKKIL